MTAALERMCPPGWFLGLVALAACATQPETKGAPSESIPVVVLIDENQFSVGNSTLFVLYQSGRVLSSVYDRSLRNSVFYEKWLTPTEQTQFIDSLSFVDVAKLAPSYESGVSDGPTWVLYVWRGGRRQRVRMNEPIDCAPAADGRGRPRRESVTQRDETPPAFAVVFDRICEATGKGKRWIPKSFELHWQHAETWRPDKLKSPPLPPAEPWPDEWRDYVPASALLDSEVNMRLVTRMPGTFLLQVERYLADCQTTEKCRLASVQDRKFIVWITFQLPGEAAWSVHPGLEM